METKHKTFKPFDKVLVKRDWCPEWTCDIYSHYNENSKSPYHTTLTLKEVKDDNIIPYEGNEHLVGTTDEPDEEEKLKDGECIVCSDCILNFENNINLYLASFVRIEDDWFVTNHDDYYDYVMRLSDFNPNDMEETKKHILRVRNGRVAKYKC